MNLLLSLITAAATLSGCASSVDALPQRTPCELPAKRIEISIVGGEPDQNYTYEDEKDDAGKKGRFPVRRPEPRDTREDVAGSDAKYLEKKRELDKRFKLMFDLKRELDIAQSITSKKWEEYYVLSQQYNEELQKLVSLWASDKAYDEK